ncbi:MAG: Obg family GTPase CgtA, partial [Clostridia bacterium]|nr:Obg family GTPase CgtA [Clostridia bacterium]
MLEKKKDTGFTIRVEDGIYIVEAEWLVPILAKIDYDDYESLQYLQRVLQTSGIDQALLDNGIQDGDTVSLYDLEFDYVS